MHLPLVIRNHSDSTRFSILSCCCHLVHNKCAIGGISSFQTLSFLILAIDRFSGGRCVNYVKENGSCHMMGFAACGCEPGR